MRMRMRSGLGLGSRICFEVEVSGAAGRKKSPALSVLFFFG